jgi:hypothetical protein
MVLIGMMLVLKNTGDEYKEHDHDNGHVGSSMHDINPRKFKRNKDEIKYIECVCVSYLSM